MSLEITVGVMKISSSRCSLFLSLDLNNHLINGISPNSGTLEAISCSVSKISPPINKVSPFLTLTDVLVDRVEIIGR